MSNEANTNGLSDAERATLNDRYQHAAHGMQTGIGYEMQWNPNPTQPKHLRVGVNNALVDQASLVKLLIARGIISEREYMTAIVEGMEAERDRYQAMLSKRFGREIELG